MTDRLASPRRGSTPKRPSTGQSAMSKAEKRLQAKAAKARALAAKKRRRVLARVGVAVVVVLLVIGGLLLFGRSKHPAQPAASSASVAPASTAAPSTAPPSTAPSGTAFPSLPAGADPALATKPIATAGTGTVSKLALTTLIAGKGAATKAGQTVTVNYVGVSYPDGKEFDSSWGRAQPISFQLGSGNVIKGWDQGLVGVKVGSRVRLDIPAALAYGDHPTDGSPGGPLRFIVDVLSAA